MTPIIEQLGALESPEAMCKGLGEYLGLPAAVPFNVLRRAQQDDKFAMHLVMSRERPNLLQLHLSDPRNASYDSVAAEAPRFSNLQLAGKVATSVAKWGAAGFKKIDPAIEKERLAECLACSNLVDGPNRLIYRVALISKSDPRICNQCGCVAARKVKVPTDSCPIGKWGAVA